MLKLSPLFLAGLMAVCSVASGQSSDKSPLAGTWQYRPRGTSCTEQYYFRNDGTMMVTSGREVSESEYTLSDEPLPSGFYKFSSKVTQTNGKPDCRGNKTPVGQASSSFLKRQGEGDGERLILCRAESLQACMGPLVRLKGLGA